MPKIDTFKLKKELHSRFPKYKWFVREQRGGLSWAYNVYSSPVLDSSEDEKLRLFLSKYESIDRDEATGEILGGGNTYVFYNGERSK